jgi:hypothetical protein
MNNNPRRSIRITLTRLQAEALNGALRRAADDVKWLQATADARGFEPSFCTARAEDGIVKLQKSIHFAFINVAQGASS